MARLKDLAQRISAATDSVVVNALCWNPPFKSDVPVGVIRMLEHLGSEMSDRGEAYRALARSVGDFLDERSLWGWGQLDVEAFVFLRAEGMLEAIEMCCNLSAMLPHLIASGELSTRDATRFWVALFDVCPEDDVAQSYLLEGLARFGDLEALACSEACASEDEDKAEGEGVWEPDAEVEAWFAARGVCGLSVVPDIPKDGAEGTRRSEDVPPSRWRSGE